MSEKIRNDLKYIKKIFDINNNIISYRIRIISPKNCNLKNVDKIFSLKKFPNAFEMAKIYLENNENCQELLKFINTNKGNTKKGLGEYFEKLPSCKTNEANIYKHFVKTPFGYTFRGYRLTYKLNNKVINKNFLFSKYQDPYKSAIEFRNTDKKTIENLSNRKNLKGLAFEFAQKYVLKNHNIEKFPTIINGIKYIGLDKINSNYYLIKECKCCHIHINISIYKKENFSPFCNSCSWSNLKNAKFYSLNYRKDKKGNLITVIKTKITIGKITNKKYLIRFNIILNSKNYENLENFKIAEKINIEYSKYLLDIFIKKHNLKYPNLLSNEVFLEFANSKIQPFEFIKHPKTIRVDEDCLNNPHLKKQQHLFKAKIQGFGINKNLNSKTVLLKEVEYIGIDNFRDHMWTTFRKDLDLPIGTTIKFKGEIYDYERNYLGLKDNKNGQAINILNLMEIDTSTKERIKLYK